MQVPGLRANLSGQCMLDYEGSRFDQSLLIVLCPLCIYDTLVNINSSPGWATHSDDLHCSLWLMNSAAQYRLAHIAPRCFRQLVGFFIVHSFLLDYAVIRQLYENSWTTWKLIPQRIKLADMERITYADQPD